MVRLLTDYIAAWTSLPKIADPLNYIETVYRNLPSELTLLEPRQNQDLGRIAMQLAYEAYEEGNMDLARTAVRQAIQYQPERLKESRCSLNFSSFAC